MWLTSFRKQKKCNVKIATDIEVCIPATWIENLQVTNETAFRPIRNLSDRSTQVAIQKQLSIPFWISQFALRLIS